MTAQPVLSVKLAARRCEHSVIKASTNNFTASRRDRKFSVSQADFLQAIRRSLTRP